MGAQTLRIVAGPEEVDRRRERIRAVPIVSGSVEDSREFLTANPIPCMRGFPGSLHC